MYVPLNKDGLPWWLRGKESVYNTWVPSLGWEDALKKKLATRSGIPAHEILSTEDGRALGHGVSRSWA